MFIKTTILGGEKHVLVCRHGLVLFYTTVYVKVRPALAFRLSSCPLLTISRKVHPHLSGPAQGFFLIKGNSFCHCCFKGAIFGLRLRFM